MFIFFVASLLGLDIQAPDMFRGILIFREDAQYVLISRSEHQIALANRDGTLSAVYNKKGQGPTELHYPVYLGRFGKEFWVLSNHDQLLSFDTQLQPTYRGRFDPGLADLDIAYGFKQNGKPYWAHRSMSTTPHLLSQVSFGDTRFQLAQSLLLQTPNGENRSALAVTDNQVAQVHGQWLAVFPVAVAEDHYLVKVYAKVSDPEPTWVLSASLDAYPPVLATRPHHGFLEGFYALADGFLIKWRGKEKRTDRHITTFIDAFSSKGRFKTRFTTENDLFPCINEPLMFVLEETKSQAVLKGFGSIKAWRTWQTANGPAH
ncbi:hypothetical protein [Acanthopleuribacter pedis]|uniref:Uncharacterized protein n=1 Tax=Acanthopleuribacter pedis TaxID=442870 RepID=A0A8J7QLU9_9BACT|nr:hypothetical protein [Acanthopleuribacter pedis]MBO1320708.1 hypothetical protein [Acanthopleuribacter pedis]